MHLCSVYFDIVCVYADEKACKNAKFISRALNQGPWRLFFPGGQNLQAKMYAII